MHCNSLRTACFVILEHFVFTITTEVCALPIANRRWGRVARVSHALCSQIQVFPTWRIVFLYLLCFLFVFVISDWSLIVSRFTHFVSLSVPDTPWYEKQAIQMSLPWLLVLFSKNQKVLFDELFLEWDFLSFLFLPTPLIFLSDVWMFEPLTPPLTLQAWTHCFLLWRAIDNN